MKKIILFVAALVVSVSIIYFGTVKPVFSERTRNKPKTCLYQTFFNPLYQLECTFKLGIQNTCLNQTKFKVVDLELET